MAIIPLAQISKLLALQRCAVFTTLKNPALQALTGSLESTYINYDPAAFKELLEKISIDKYDGVRVYFANIKKDLSNDLDGDDYLPEGQDKKFTLIFVPTILSIQDGFSVHDDDTDNCLIIDKSGIVRKLTFETASGCVTEYQLHKKPFFQQDGVSITTLPDYQEAICIWYNNNLIRRNNINGMLDYMDELMNDKNNPLKVVTVFFAGYLNGEKTVVDGVEYDCAYKLTQVLYFQQMNNIDSSADKNVLYSSADETPSNYLDTGNPCPPPSHGCTGTKLP